MDNQEIAKVLRKVVRLFGADGRGWTKGVFAATSKTGFNRKYFCEYELCDTKKATCYCLDGGIIKALGEYNHDKRTEVANALGFTCCADMQHWNDHKYRKISEVRDLLFKTIRRLESCSPETKPSPSV